MWCICKAVQMARSDKAEKQLKLPPRLTQKGVSVLSAKAGTSPPNGVECPRWY